MPRIELPDLLYELAIAKDEGVPLSRALSPRSQVDICRTWGFDLMVRDDRIFLQSSPDLLLPVWIESETPVLAWETLCVRGFLEVGSTNDEARALARQGAACGTIVYAERQTAGRGRKGRDWSAPAGSGLYFSIVLRPTQPRVHWPLLTHATSIALVQALDQVSASDWSRRRFTADIKWPNDVLLSGRKVAGILIETGGRPDGVAVAGIGINVKSVQIPGGLPEGATSVSDEAGSDIPRRWLLVRFLDRLQVLYSMFERGGFEEILALWKSRSSMWKDTPVWIGEGAERCQAVTCGLSKQGGLRVRFADGAERTLLAEDVSVRLI